MVNYCILIVNYFFTECTDSAEHFCGKAPVRNAKLVLVLESMCGGQYGVCWFAIHVLRKMSYTKEPACYIAINICGRQAHSGELG